MRYCAGTVCIVSITLCILLLRDAMRKRELSIGRCPSVSPPVTLVYCIKTAIDIFNLPSRPGSPVILVVYGHPVIWVNLFRLSKTGLWSASLLYNEPLFVLTDISTLLNRSSNELHIWKKITVPLLKVIDSITYDLLLVIHSNYKRQKLKVYNDV